MIREFQFDGPLPPGQTLIYALSDPTTGTIRFVGTTHLPAACMHGHLSGKRSRRVPGLTEWVAGLIKAGTPPRMLELAIENGNFAKLCSHERHFIERLREGGDRLFNESA